MSDTSDALPGWTARMKALAPVGDRLMAKWGRANASEAEQLEMETLAFGALANGYLSHVYLDPARPVFVPCWNLAMNLAGPAPDYVYRTAEIDPAGTYRITGYRGTTRFVEITQQRWMMIGNKEVQGVSPASGDVDSLNIGPDGRFEVVLSAERPADYQGDWWALEANVIRLLVRECGCDWNTEIDSRMSIERLDPAPPVSSADVTRRLANLAEWVEKIIAFDIELANFYRADHGTNVLTRSKKIETMGGLPEQIYYDGAYDIGDDEALIIETDLPKKSRYWSILVANDRFSTLDWVNSQTSLNDTQARIDGDGKLRVIVSARDPGVPNWLDKADQKWGIIQLRWNRPSDAPDPVVIRVPVEKVRDHLPEDTPRVTPEERKALLRHRREGAQYRRFW